MNTEQTVLREGFLSDEQKKSFEKILTEIVLSYDKQRDAKDVKQFCADYMAVGTVVGKLAGDKVGGYLAQGVKRSRKWRNPPSKPSWKA